MKNKILLVEDDMGLALSLKDFFEDNGLFVIHTNNGNEAFTLYKQESPDLILLDIILPNKNGFEIISEIRDIDFTTLIVLMTGTEFDTKSEIKGYELGAINYIKKPVLPQAVLAMIKNLLFLPKELKLYELKEYTIQIHSQYVKINGIKVKLREKDAHILNILLDKRNQVISRRNILHQVWFDDSPERNNALDGAILRLRKVFQAYQSIQIKTIYGNGYILEV